jgi:hypothetical protein
VEILLSRSTSEPVTWAISRRGHARYARAALVGGVLPVVLALVNQRLVGRMVAGYETAPTLWACGAILVEIAVVGFLCAKLIEPVWMRWLAYGWMWALLDGVLAPRLVDGIWWGHPMALLAPAMLSAQLLLVAIWAVFGSTRWSIRWPVALALLALGAGVPLTANAYSPHQVVLLVTTQSVLFLAGCWLLFRRGFRLGSGGERRHIAVEPSAAISKTQFFLRDLVLWTTLAATLLALARIFVLQSHAETLPLAARESGLMYLTGTLSAVVLVTALCAMLGEKWIVVRWAGLPLASVVAVVLSGAYYYFFFAWRGIWPESDWHPLLGWTYWAYYLRGKWHLLAWIGMSAAMLMASLVFLRAQGYRMERAWKES